MNTLDKFSYHVYWSDVDECFIASPDEAPSVKTHGSTQAAALKECKIALEAVIEAALEDGETPPTPFSERSYSGKFQVRMTPDQHRDIDRMASTSGVSMNTLIINKIFRER